MEPNLCLLLHVQPAHLDKHTWPLILEGFLDRENLFFNSKKGVHDFRIEMATPSFPDYREGFLQGKGFFVRSF